MRQGENLYTFLFSNFLNDLESFYENRDIVGLETATADIERQLNVFLKILCILYADDTILMAEPLMNYNHNLIFITNIVSTGN